MNQINKNINTEIFEKLQQKTQKVIYEELRKCFNVMKIKTQSAKTYENDINDENEKRDSRMQNKTASVSPKIAKNKNKNVAKLSILNMLNIEYTEFGNKVEEVYKDDISLSIVSISFSLFPNKDASTNLSMKKTTKNDSFEQER